MTSAFWIMLAVIVIGFIITWIACSKAPCGCDSLDCKPGMLMINPYDSEKEMLRSKVGTLERQLYSLQREYDYFRRGSYERPVEVNIENIVKVETNETTSKSSCR